MPKEAILALAHHLRSKYERWRKELNPLGWALLDFAYEYALKEAEERMCFEEVWSVLFEYEEVDVARTMSLDPTLRRPHY